MKYFAPKSVSAITLLAIGLLATAATSQQPAAQPATGESPAATAPPAAAVDPAQAKAVFTRKLDEYRAAVRDIEALRVKYQTADAEARKKINAEMSAHVANAQSLMNGVVEAAIEAYRAAPNTDPQITDLLKAIARYDTLGRALEVPKDGVDGGDRFEEALPIIKALVDGGSADRNVYLWGFIAAFSTADFDLAEQYLQQAQTAKAVDEPGADRDPTHKNMVRLVTMFAPAIDQYRKMWEKESAIRAAEAKADDLPRVKLTTSKGEITLELFENEAPVSVANFLSLVKQGYYTDTPFHRVLPGFMAQGGAKTADGEGGPGYTIRGEHTLPNHREHFRGSLSMARKPGQPDSGSSQFFLTFVPAPHLDGEHAVFGRVVDGLEVLGDIQRRDPQMPNQPTPDRILKAEVLRDRNHDYEFDKRPGD